MRKSKAKFLLFYNLIKFVNIKYLIISIHNLHGKPGFIALHTYIKWDQRTVIRNVHRESADGAVADV